MERPNKPERFGVYKVQSKGMPPIVLANESVAPWYEIVPYPEIGGLDSEYIKFNIEKYGRPDAKRIYWGDTWIYTSVDRKTISEHKESKVNPDLEEGDIIRVIEIDGEHARMPERFGVYEVQEIKQDNATQDFYYDLVPFPLQK